MSKSEQKTEYQKKKQPNISVTFISKLVKTFDKELIKTIDY